MSETTEQSVALPAVVDLDALDGLRDTMLDGLDQAAITVDCSKVERIATNGLIMLLSAAESARRTNVAFSLGDPSDAMKSAVERLGLSPSFTDFFEG